MQDIDSKNIRKQYRNKEKHNKTTHKQQVFALMARFLVFYPVKMYFQMLSHPVTLANKGVNTISYWNCHNLCDHWSPVPAYLEGSEFPRKKSKNRVKRLWWQYCVLVKPLVPHKKLGITGVIIWHQPKQMHNFWREILQIKPNVEIALVTPPPPRKNIYFFFFGLFFLGTQ